MNTLFKSLKSTATNKSNREGAMLPMIAVTLVILIIGVAFSIDIAYMHMTRAELRTATDAAARAGAETLARLQDEDAAIASAVQVAGLNNVSGTQLILDPSQVILGSIEKVGTKRSFVPNVAPFTAVRVVGDRTDASPQGAVPLFFGKLLGQSDFQPTQIATASASVRDIALVLDISGSMDNPAGDISRLEALKEAVATFIAEIQSSSPNSTLSLTTYSDNASRDIPLTANFDSVQNAVNDLVTISFTNINEGLLFGSDSLEEDPLTRDFAEKTIVLMTDGRFNRGGTPKKAADIAAGRGHQIHTITFSAGANQPIMQQVAEIGGGNHFHADDAGDLTEVFRTIARSLSVLLIE